MKIQAKIFTSSSARYVSLGFILSPAEHGFILFLKKQNKNTVDPDQLKPSDQDPHYFSHFL